MRSRRAFLASFAITLALASAAIAQTYPARPVRIIAGAAASSTPDILARLTGQWLSERLGQQFIVDNRPGGGGNIATEAAVRATADGYTLLLVATNNAINATLHEKLNFNFISDIAPVASIVRLPYVMLVHPSVPANTVPEFIAYAKANVGKITMASSGIGTGPHLAGELFKMMAGVDMVHIPYRGAGPALNDLLGGQVQASFSGIAASIEHVRTGKLRALAVSAESRSDALPDIPPLADFLAGYEASGWYGIGAPRNTPPAIVAKLNREVNAGLADPRIKGRLVDLGGTVLSGSPADFAKVIADETEKWARVIRFSGAKAH